MILTRELRYLKKEVLEVKEERILEIVLPGRGLREKEGVVLEVVLPGRGWCK